MAPSFAPRHWFFKHFHPEELHPNLRTARAEGSPVPLYGERAKLRLNDCIWKEVETARSTVAPQGLLQRTVPLSTHLRAPAPSTEPGTQQVTNKCWKRGGVGQEETWRRKERGGGGTKEGEEGERAESKC